MATMDDVHSRLPPVAVLGFTAYGEAANQPLEGQVAVMATARNRWAQRTTSSTPISAVCLQALQYSCWNADASTNHARLLGTVDLYLNGDPPGPVLRQCLALAQLMLDLILLDNTNGATHYLTKALFMSPMAPEWVKGKLPCASIGAHAFFRGIAPYR